MRSAEIDVFCTHLTPDVGSLAPPAGRTWREVHGGQVDALGAWIDTKSDGARPILLMGDLNTGPRFGREISGRHADHYAKLVSRGFVNAYTMQGEAMCTFCDANPLNGGGGTRGTLIDHILTKRFDGRIHVEPILRGVIEVPTGSGSVRTSYSDHYGLKATLRGPR